MNKKEYALIVAGGKGSRIKGTVPKQFIELNGMPVLMHTLLTFYSYSESLSVILVLPEDDFPYWNELCIKHNFNKPLVLQKGGDTRFQSVRNGLAKIASDGLVAIHDGVRPLVSESIIRASFQLAAKQQTAVAAVPLKDSIREVNANSSIALDRSAFRLIQTPQTFDVNLIRKAYEINEDSQLTDDASVAEKAGHTISLFEGSYDNIKITTAEDLIFAETLLALRNKKSR